MPEIIVSAVCFQRTDSLVLTVRKRGTDKFMLPGGKPEPGETAVECAIREIGEELGLQLQPTDVTLLGSFGTAAANESGQRLCATVFRTDYRTADLIEPVVQAEIDEFRWVNPAVDDDNQAPLNREHVFPLLAAERSSLPHDQLLGPS